MSCVAEVGSSIKVIIMEESEKRKKRLEAMRMEAAGTGADTDSESPGLASDALSNPLIESETASASPHHDTSPRFDYYTDPLSAFSSRKRANNISPQVSQGHYGTPPRPMDQGMTPNPVYHYPALGSPGPSIFHAPRPHFNQSPVGAGSPLNRPQLNPTTSFNYGAPPNFSRGANFTSPGFRQVECSPYVNYGQGSGRQGQNSRPNSGSGLGRVRGGSVGNNSMSLGSGSSSRRGVGSCDSIPAELRPNSYYRKEMVKDPWESLSPVMWKGVGAFDSSDESWLPESIATKKSKVSSEAPHTSISQQSLAEYLALSFDDSIDEAVDEKVA
ncbi:hypothetical protein OROGR_021344 [Orobanche gracilis]